MKIAIIGHGNVGGTLAKGLANSGHEVMIGARNPGDQKALEISRSSENIQLADIVKAVEWAEVGLVAIPAPAVKELAKSLPDVRQKVIIDATNSVFEKPKGYNTGAEALKAITGCRDVVKGFNTTGFENMADPIYHGRGIDMFTAGDSSRGKKVVEQLALDLGFEHCYDFGGDDRFELIEQFAFSWINLAIMQGQGRNIAFKILKREKA